MNRSAYYSDEEKDVLRRLYKAAPRADILAALPDRNWKAITLQARRLYLTRQHVAANAWGPTEDAALREHYSLRGGRYVSAQLNRTLHAVHRRAEVLGIRSARVYCPRPDSKDYTTAEHELLRQLYPLASMEALLAALPSRSWKSLQSMAIRLKIRRLAKPPAHWPPAHDEVLREHYPLRGAAYVGELVGRSPLQVRGHAKLLGIRYAPERGPRKPRIYIPKPTGNPPGRPRKQQEAQGREVRLKRLHPGRTAVPKKVKEKKVLVPKVVTPNPVAVVPEPVKRSPTTPLLNARAEQRRKAEKVQAEKPKTYVTAAEIRALPAAHPARLAYTRAAYNGPAAATEAFHAAMKQAA